jgi:hypothetical protein
MDYTTMTATELRTAATELNVDLTGLDLRKRADKATAIARLESVVVADVAADVTEVADISAFCAVVDAITYSESTDESPATAEAVTYEAEGTYGDTLIAAIAWVAVFVLRTVRPQLNALIRWVRSIILTACPVERYNGRWQVRMTN